MYITFAKARCEWVAGPRATRSNHMHRRADYGGDRRLSSATSAMDADLELLGQELERWAAMDKARVGVAKERAPSEGETSPTSSEGGNAAKTLQETPPQEQPRPKKKRVRRQREELLYLRKKAKQLEDELERLRLSEAAATDAQVASVGSAASLWEGIASRQQQVRCQAEDENRRLKQMLENQLTLARRFECFLTGSGGPGSSVSACGVVLSVV